MEQLRIRRPPRAKREAHRITEMTNVAETAKPAQNSSPARTGSRLSDNLPSGTLAKWLKDMLLIREFEVRCMQAYQQARIGGFCHIYIGQEACAVGTIGSVNPDDPIITA